MRARFAAVILSLALVYATTCSATCAICLGSSAATAAAGQNHACEHAAPDAGGAAQKQCPVKPDCFAHHHSGFEFVQSDAVMQIRLSTTGHVSPLVGGAVRTEDAIQVALFRSDLAPRQDAAISPPQNTSILRI
jgi:hypothetical protein